MAARALRKLHSSLHLLDPEIAEDLFAESLLTRVDKEKIDAGNTPTKKASLILNTLGRREPKKALQGLIRALEKDKIENEEMLKKISEGSAATPASSNCTVLIVILFLSCSVS